MPIIEYLVVHAVLTWHPLWLITKPHQLFLHLMQFHYDPLSSFIYSWWKWKEKVKISVCYGELETMIRIHERESIQHHAYMDDLNLPCIQMRTEMVINTNNANQNHLNRFPSLTIHCFLIDLSQLHWIPRGWLRGCFKAQWPTQGGYGVLDRNLLLFLGSMYQSVLRSQVWWLLWLSKSKGVIMWCTAPKSMYRRLGNSIMHVREALMWLIYNISAASACKPPHPS